MPREPDTSVDSEAVRAWLTASDLLLAAEEAAMGESRITLGIAVILADASVEASLGIIAEQGEGGVPDRAEYARLWELATARHPLSPSLRTRLPKLHRQRNYVLHQGGTVDARHASAATRAARELFNGRLGQLEQLTRGELVLAQFPQRLHRLYSHSEDLPLLGEVEVARVV